MFMYTFMQALRPLRFFPVFLTVASFAQGCGNGGGRNPDRPFGETAIVVTVNPRVNDAHTTTVPNALGTTRQGIAIDAQPGGGDTTDARGLAVLTDLDAGALDLVFDGDATLPFTIASEGDVYDLAVAYDGTTVGAFDNFPVRYGVGGQILEFDSSADPADVQTALSGNGNIVFFRNGTFTGDLTVTGDDVIFFGEGFTERQVVIDGSVTINGTGVRIRGFTITGNLNAPGNDFGLAWSVVRGSAQISGNAGALLHNAFCGTVTVPSSNATVLENEGMSPLPAPAAALCN